MVYRCRNEVDHGEKGLDVRRFGINGPMPWLMP